MATTTTATVWSRQENKIFENALVQYPEEVPNRLSKIAGCLSGKTLYDVIEHYDALLHDVQDIEADLIQLPAYSDLPATTTGADADAGGSQSGARKKSKAWTAEEHKLFLIGLERYGRGDWRNISRKLLKTRQPSQVASHAQKYFNRLLDDKKKRKRSSIHDVKIDSTDLAQVHVHSSDPDSPYTLKDIGTGLSKVHVHSSDPNSPYILRDIDTGLNKVHVHSSDPHSPYTLKDIDTGLSKVHVHSSDPNSPYTLRDIDTGLNKVHVHSSDPDSPYTLRDIDIDLSKVHVHSSDPDSPYTLRDNVVTPLPYLYPSTNQLSYTTPSNAGMTSNHVISMEHSSYTTPSNAGMTSNHVISMEHSSYTTPSNIGMANNMYPATEQSLHVTSNAYTSGEQSPSSTDYLAFGDINTMGRDIDESYPP